MSSFANVYAHKALCQMPRLLSSQDRNRYSLTYGCMNREYWLCRSTDFPNSIAQFGTHALALAYAHEMPGNTYFRHPKVLEWALAGMDYWTRIQHRDGSFDEFYPNERGWAGPTGFLLYVMCDSYHLLDEHIPDDLRERLLKAFDRAARFLCGTDESGVLANHHAMALLPIYEAYAILQEEKIKKAFHVKLDEFFGYSHDEGWCLEYDGADPGYLSATISFMAKLRKRYEDERFMPHFQKWVEFSSYFVYPNGHYAGTAGSRQTLHFYPHGYELLAGEIPLAGRIADRMLEGLRDGALVPPEIQSERYFVYRMPELMLSYIDYGPRSENLPPLPYEHEAFHQYFPGAKIQINTQGDTYTVINAAKGGVVKHFQKSAGTLRLNNCGVVGQLKNGTVFTSQWIDEAYRIETGEAEVVISGRCQRVPSKLFNPYTFMAFRLVALGIGWNQKMAYWLKGLIRKMLMLGSKPLPVQFTRRITFEDERIEVRSELRLEKPITVTGLQVGDEFPARYVPQSRYFQQQELNVHGYVLSQTELDQLNRDKKITVTEVWHSSQAHSSFSVGE